MLNPLRGRECSKKLRSFCRCQGLRLPLWVKVTKAGNRANLPSRLFAKWEEGWIGSGAQGTVNLEPRLGLGDVPWGALWGDLCESFSYGDICFDCAMRFVGS